MIKFIFSAVMLVGAYGETQAIDEKSILKVYDDLEKSHKRFLGNTSEYRKDFEAFVEDKYEPAVKAMNKELAREKCAKCMSPYLKTMALLEGSAYEALTYDLKDLIQVHGKKLAKGCKAADSRTLKKLQPQFETAFDFMVYEKVKSEEVARLKNDIRSCLVK